LPARPEFRISDVELRRPLMSWKPSFGTYPSFSPDGRTLAGLSGGLPLWYGATDADVEAQRSH
jgi:hypothetical protein